MFTTQNKLHECDDILRETLEFLRKNWLNENTGIVACCLVDGDKKSFATSSKNQPFWKHAERNAYEEFKKQYDIEPSESAMFVVTLSPCVNNLKHRQEESCAHLMNQLGIKRIHFGVLDFMHADSLEIYRHAGLIPSLTGNTSYKMMCEKLMSLFSIYDSRINSDLIGIKNELGDHFFAELDNKNKDIQIMTRKHKIFPEKQKAPDHITFKHSIKDDNLPELLSLLRNNAYWQAYLTLDRLKLLINNSRCFFAIYNDKKIVGFSRVLANNNSFASLWDVVVDEQYRGKNIGISLMFNVFTDEALSNIENWILFTDTAKGFYQKFGFIDEGEIHTQKIRCGVR